MNTVAIVGNGPSAEGRGAEIDACEFVVRCNNCIRMGAGRAGVRIDALAWFGDRESRCSPPPGDYEHWITLPPHRHWPPHWQHKGGWEKIVEAANGRAAIRWVTDWQWQREAAELARVGAGPFAGRDWTAPTTGFTAVDMALRALRPARLCLYGFDATAPDAPGYDAGPCSWQHDFTGEKLHLAALRDHGHWLGESLGWTIAVTWPDAPALPQTDTRLAAGLPPEPPAPATPPAP